MARSKATTARDGWPTEFSKSEPVSDRPPPLPPGQQQQNHFVQTANLASPIIDHRSCQCQSPLADSRPMPQIPQDEGFDDYISIDLAGERYTVQLEKWAQFVSLDRDNMQQFLQENDSSRRTTLTSVYPPLLCASGPFIFQPAENSGYPDCSPQRTQSDGSTIVQTGPFHDTSPIGSGQGSSIGFPSHMPSQYVTAVRPSGSEISKKRPLSPDQDESADSSTEDVKIDLAHKEEQTIPSKKTLTFRIGDESQLDGFYCKTFLLLQQATMKLILKAWIKFIEPEKQKKWPYCLSSERRPKDSVKPRKTPDGKLQPPWWPEGVKHIEPDHLGKEGCHKLALVIIKMVQDQPECHGKGVQMLREETYKLNLRFDNEREDKYILRQYHLHQLFDVAAKQQDLIQGCIDADELCSVDNLEPAPKMQRTYQEQEGARPKKRARRGKGNAAVEGQLHYMEMIGGQLDPSDSPTTSTDALVTMSAHHPGTRVQFPRMGSTGWENAQDQTISISPQDKAAVDSQIIMTGGLQPDYQHPLMALPIVGNHLYNANQLPMNMGHVPQIQSLPWYVSSPAAAGQASYGI